MTPKKIVSLVSLAVIALFGLTACSTVTEAEVLALDHKVFQVKLNSLERNWEYEDSNGTRQKMSKCEDRGFWDKTCFETPDGVIQFEYSTSKGSLVSRVITVDGVKQETLCVITGGFWNGKNLCGTV